MLCDPARCREVIDRARKLLDTAGLTAQLIGHQADNGQPLARVVARLRCTDAEQSTLVDLVTRLGQEPTLRSARWERVPD